MSERNIKTKKNNNEGGSMTALAQLYETAFLNDVTVVNWKMKQKALSIMDEDGDCYIALNIYDLMDEREEAAVLAHDLGHCMTGAFYNRYSRLNVISQKEYRANRWAVHNLLPYSDLQEAFRKGICDPWELAEYFEMTEEFIRLALKIYKNEEPGY